MPLYTPFKMTLNGVNHIVILPSITYKGANATFLKALGFTPLTDKETIESFTSTISFSEGILTGKLIRMRISYKPVCGKTKSTKVVCTADKAPTAFVNVLNKPFKGGIVVSACFPRRKRLG